MKSWLRRLFGKTTPTELAEEAHPSLLRATTFADNDIGKAIWNTEHNSDLLTITNKGQTIEWKPRQRGEDELSPVWVPASTSLRLHSGQFRWDFIIDEMASRQIGVGFMLLWDVGPDWGFFGYLGASPTAWAYDPSTGDVVCATESIQGGLPKFEDGHTGVVSVELKIPRYAEGVGKFIVNGTETQPIPLPAGAVVLPAACFLKETQKITLANFERL
jgi:hypothetical protein